MSLVLIASILPVAGAVFVETTDSGGSSVTASHTFAAVRTVTYEIGPGLFTGTTHTLILDQHLAPDYFVILHGGAGDGTNLTTGPDLNNARVSGDPFGNFGPVTGSNELQLERRGSGASWQGQVTVVESVRDATGSGFALVDVIERSMGPGVTNASSTAASPWSNVNQVGVYAGPHGGGVDTTAPGLGEHQSGWARVYPSGSNGVHFEREAGRGGTLAGTARFTAYVIEWGSDWTIQRATVTGSSGGNGVNSTSEYDTAVISPIARASTFVLGYGRTFSNRLSGGWSGNIVTLGDGVNQLSTETLVAVGAESADSRTVEVYVHTHPGLSVTHVFGPDGTVANGALSGTVTIGAATDVESFVAAPSASTGESRFSVLSNSSGGNNTAYSTSLIWSRIAAGTTLQWTRARSGQPAAFWLQVIDIAGVGR